MTTADPREQQPFQQPVGDRSAPAGYSAFDLSWSNYPPQDRAELSKLAAKVLKDPLLLRQLSDQVYELMQLDLQRQRERRQNYGGEL